MTHLEIHGRRNETVELGSNARSPRRFSAWPAAAATVIAACVGPLSDDAVPKGQLRYLSVADVPSASAAQLAQIDAHDNVGRVIERRSAFSGGQRVWYWDFGPAPARVLPLYALVRMGDDGKPALIAEHPFVIDSIPGDSGYTPFWTVYFVPVTASWDGEAIASVADLQLAEATGLVETPFVAGLLSNCPVVHPDVRLVTRDSPEVPPAPVFYRGVQVSFYGMGFYTPAEDGNTPVSDVVQLRRLGGEPVDEGARGVDITGDADTNDSNNLFRLGEGETPLWRVVKAAVPEDRSLVDDSQDEATSSIADFSILFEERDWPELTPVAGQVLALEPTEVLVNCPIEPKPVPGGGS